jgi:nicotinamide-nucleotide amidase
MPTAEIITIGTEILLGEIVDTNAQYLARELRDIGVDLYRKTTVGDNARRIAQAIQQGLERSMIIITTGGLGPTVDDPTREAVALAMNVQTEYHPELWEQIQARFRRFNRIPTENNRKQAYIPQGALVIENAVGTAPAFIVEAGEHAVISLPGVPREMEYLMQRKVIPYLRAHYHLHEVIKARIVHTAGAGESQIDELVGDLETLNNPTVGLAAHSGQVDVRITAKAGSEEEADRLIQEVEVVVRQRLGNWIYGVDDESLEEVALKAVERHGWTLAVVEAGLGGDLIKRLASVQGPFLGGELLTNAPSPGELQEITMAYRQTRTADAAIGIALIPGPEKQEVYFTIITPLETQQMTRPYGGPPGNAPTWAIHHSLDILRNL